jgi:hypothetical protein
VFVDRWICNERGTDHVELNRAADTNMSLLNAGTSRDIVDRLQADVWVGHGIASGVPAGLDFAYQDATGESLVVVAALHGCSDSNAGSADNRSSDIVEVVEVSTDFADSAWIDDTVEAVEDTTDSEDTAMADQAVEVLSVPGVGGSCWCARAST